MTKPESPAPTHSKTDSEKALNLLAEQLALNYFNNCSIDFLPSQYEHQKNDLKKLKKIVFDKKRVNADSYIQGNNVYRNILVIGAGATANAFENIPLAGEAITIIQKKIIIAKVPVPVKNENSDDETITYRDLSFDYFIKFYQCFNSIVPPAFDINKANLGEEFDDGVLNGYLSAILGIEKQELDKIEILDHGLGNHKLKIGKDNVGLLSELGKRYFREYEKLRLYSSKSKSAQENKRSKESGKSGIERIDFETSLYLLSEIFSSSTVGTLIQQIYDVKHGPTLFYQLVAHLFKNGFIDAIINFNFDELLDQAISDEIENDGYDLILSDGDCKSFDSVSFDNKLRQPLYIKPHGTASHKSTLRFTKNHYHELPQDMRRFLEDLISARTKSSNLKVNLITTGFGMESLEFNDIIATNLPEESRIFSFFHHKSKNRRILGKYCQEKKDRLEFIFENRNKPYPEIRFIGHEFYPSVEMVGLESSMATLGNSFYELYKRIDAFYLSMFRPPSIHRHLIISKLFGNSKVWKELNGHLKGVDKAKSGTQYPRDYFTSTNYLKDRILVEILINLIANNGLLDPTLLMKGNVGKYYSQYFEQENEPIALAHFMEYFDLNGIKDQSSHERVLISPLKIRDFNIEEKGNLESLFKEIFNSKKVLSHRISNFLGKSDVKRKVLPSLFENFLAIKDSNNSKIQSKLRSTTHHTFRNYRRSDLVTNNLSYNLHFYTGATSMSKLKINTICVIADYAHQLRHFMNLIALQGGFKFIYVILAYPIYKENLEPNDPERNDGLRADALDRLTSVIENPELKEKMRKIIKIRFRPIKRHNHHMTIFMNYDKSHFFNPTKKLSGFLNHNKNVSKVIYYYKKGLSESINPIRIEEPDNIQYLLEKFKYYADRAKQEFKANPGSEELWITDDEWKDYL